MTPEESAKLKKNKAVFIPVMIFAAIFAIIALFSFINSDNKIDSIAPTSGVGATPIKVTGNDTVSGKPVAPSGNINTQKEFYTVDSAECKIYKTSKNVGRSDSIYSMIVGTGSAGGPVGSSLTIYSNPLYGTDADLVRGISCSSWTAKKSQPQAEYSDICVREPGQPFTTTWTMIAEGPRYAQAIGRERTIYLRGVLDDGQHTGTVVNNPFAFQCLTDNGY